MFICVKITIFWGTKIYKNPRKRLRYGVFYGSPGWTRTSDTLINSQVLLPTELRRNIKSDPVRCVRPADRNWHDLRRKIYTWKCRHSPIFPRRRHLSIFGVYELNFCVRNGNRWNLIAICTDFHIQERSHTFVCSNPQNRIKETKARGKGRKHNSEIEVKPSTD